MSDRAYVLDTSMAAAWFIADEANEFAEALLDNLPNSQIFVPALWPIEITNALLQARKRNRITETKLDEIGTILPNLGLIIDYAIADEALPAVIQLARHYRLTTYDAAYLELALRKKLPLATRDAALIAACQSAAVKVLGLPTAA